VYEHSQRMHGMRARSISVRVLVVNDPPARNPPVRPTSLSTWIAWLSVAGSFCYLLGSLQAPQHYAEEMELGLTWLVGPARNCSPRQQADFEPPCIELNGIL
jgi:hypothetical protein